MNRPQIDFAELSQHMRYHLSHIARLRRVVRLLACIIYPAALLWLLYCMVSGFVLPFIEGGAYTQLVPTTYILIFFGIFVVAHYAFHYSLASLRRREAAVMVWVIDELFPTAEYHLVGGANAKKLGHSRLFGEPKAGRRYLDAMGYGYLEIPVEEDQLRIADVGVTSFGSSGFGAMTFVQTFYYVFLRPIFGTRLESSMYSFRGMFGYCQLPRPVRGFVVLVPDHLERRVGYLAQSIQSLSTKYGSQLVQMEDPEFEQLFTVYADDQVEARRILTPAMMRRLTDLRRTFGRDLMVSFRDDTFYYASETPDGFLRPGRQSLKQEHLLERLYHEIAFCTTVREEMGRAHRSTVE